ncbi:MAG: SatD family protein [bacterium]
MTKADTHYLTLIGDLVASRALAPGERAEVQERFKSVLGEVNEKFREEIASLFLITAGDEAQGILKRPDYSYEIVRHIQIGLAPVGIIFGLGYGPLSTEVGEFAVGADGPAFHLAREALTKAKQERKVYGKSILRDVRLHSHLEFLDTVVNGLFLSLSVLKNRWTEKQSRVLHLLEQGENQTSVAKSLQSPLSNISRTIETAHYREYESLVASLIWVFRNGFKKDAL